ncbi:MAG TPA: hypothetical protein VE981_03420 [Planctomycetota bacterium]|nr:hypothetical protein [Planctomycetota bacterium]
MNALLIALSLLCAQSTVARRVAREVVDSFGREAVEAAEPRVLRLVEAYGEEAGTVLRKVGPSGVPVLERFGAPGLRILARWGDDGVRLLALEGETATAALARYGEEGVELMIRHPGIGRDLLTQLGGQVLRTPLKTESMVTLGRLSDPIRNSGRSAEILSVVEKYGDRACDFLWRNKGTIFVGALLATFLNDPKPYIDGVKQLVVNPASQLAHEAASQTNWTLVVIVGMLIASAGLGIRWAWSSRASRAYVLDSPGGRP